MDPVVRRDRALWRRKRRFWDQVDIHGPIPQHRRDLGECWLWTGNDDGRYGVFGRSKAHRVASEWSDGIIADGICVLHHCDTTLCVRPSHLFRGTQLDNIADMVAKGRARGKKQNGESNTHAKLTTHDIRAIRAAVAAGANRRAVAAGAGIHVMHLHAIVRRAAWAHVP